MEIENKRGILDLELESTLEIERTNPLFNEQGSYSLPFSIKRSPHNDYVLGFPALYEMHSKYEDKQEVHIHAGLFNEKATLEIFDTSEVIEGTFYLFESSFYNKAQEVKLTTVFDGVERWFSSRDLDRESRVKYIVDMLGKMITSIPKNSDEFTIFPVITDGEPVSTSTLTDPQIKPDQIINEIERVETGGFPEYKLKARNAISQTDSDGNNLKFPVGHAITPFLKLNYVLRKIFEYFGYTLEESIIDTDPMCQRWCVVNNTMDSIWNGYFIESQLVPDCTVNDFLNIIREGMCADFRITEATKTAKIIFFNDVLDAEPDTDLTPYLVAPYEKVGQNKPKQVKLSIQRKLPFAETSTDTWTEFQKKYPDFSTIQPMFLREGMYPIYLQNTIWKFSDPLPGWLFNEYKTDRISSMNFDYDTTDNIERENHKIPMESLATAYFSTNSIDHYFAPIIGTIRNLNSFVITDGAKQTEEKAECPIMLSCECWDVPSRIGLQHNNSPGFAYNNSLLLWTDDGLFNRFWKRYDQLLRNSFRTVIYKAKLPALLLHTFTFERLKVINGQLMFPVSLKYKIEEQDFIEVEMEFKTVKYYKDDNLESGTSENGKDPNLEELVGTWNIIKGSSTTDGFKAKFQLNEDYTGTIYLEYENKKIDTTFDKLSYSKNDISIILTLNTPSGSLIISLMKMVSPPGAIFLTWTGEDRWVLLEKNN